MNLTRLSTCTLTGWVFLSVLSTNALAGTVQVLAPDGGEQWGRGSTIQVFWNTDTIGTGNVNIELLTSGAPIGALTVTTPDDGSHTFFLPANLLPANVYKIRVIKGVAQDSSDSEFEVLATRSTTLDPIVGPYIVGQDLFFTWTSTAGGLVNVKLFKGGVENATISTNLNNYSNINFDEWDIPGNQTPGTDYTIRVISTDDGAIFGESAQFEIQAQTITVTSPNGVATYVPGANVSIIFTDNFGGGNFKIEAFKGAALVEEISASTTSHFALWEVPATQAADTDYRIKVSKVGDPTVFGFSANFEVTEYLVVTAPNFGDLAQGTTRQITWLGNSGTDMKIELIDSLMNISTIVASTPNDGSYDWAIPAGQAPGEYKIRLTALPGGTSTDDSGTFDIEAANLSNPEASSSAPNKVARGRAAYLSWNSNLGGTITAEIKKGAGTPTTIIASTADDRFENWTVPAGAALGTDYKAIVTSIEYPAFTATQATTFEVQDPAITVTQPAAATVWVRGNLQAIVWNSNLIIDEQVKIELLKNGTLHTTLFATHDNDGFANWTTPTNFQLGADYSVRVKTTDDAVVALSGVFSIADPSITVTAPNGGEEWRVNTAQTITWTSNLGSEPLRVVLLKKNGASYDEYTEFTVNGFNGQFVWNIPLAHETDNDFRVRVERYFAPIPAADDSDADFSVVPRLQVFIPNGGEQWAPESTHAITWNPGGGTDVTIELLPEGGGSSTISSNAPDNGSFMWAIPVGQALGNFKIKITSNQDGGLFDQSNAVFAIVARSLTNVFPFGGQDWAPGSQQTLTWDTNFGGVVDIELWKDGAKDGDIVTDTANDGSFIWTIPGGQALDENYRVKIFSNDGTVSAQSSSDFAIRAPFITVAAPNGGETWVRGTTRTIAWTSNLSADVKILLKKGAAAPTTIVDPTPNDGSFDWNIPVGTTAGSDYRIIVSRTDDSVTDMSNSDVTIAAQTITVSAPNGGEQWTVGTPQGIAWTSNALNTSNVIIELTDGGAVVDTISASTPNDGSFSWAIPGGATTGTNYKVRITSLLDAAGTDESNAVFTLRVNQAPTANAGPDRTVKETAAGISRVTLDGSASTDDGAIAPLTYTWKKGVLTLGTGVTLQVDLAVNEVHTITLEVFDGQLMHSDTANITVQPNAPPTASAGPDQTVQQQTLGGRVVTLNGSSSTDDNSYGPLTYEWKEGTTVLGTLVQITPELSVGVHDITLKVFDGQYDHTDTVRVTVTPAPNLIVQSVVVPDEAWTDRGFDVTWTVKNTGGGDAPGNWTDRILLSRDDMPGADIELANFPFVGGLDSNESVTRTQVITIPRPGIVEREYRIRVVTDRIPGQIDEGPFENDNDTTSVLFDVHPVPLPELVVESIQNVPATTFPDQTITVTYTIKNNGPGATDVPTWNDTIHLSVDTQPDEFDFVVVSKPNVAALAPGESYTFSANLVVPRDLTGSYYVVVKADSGNAVVEDDDANNASNVPLTINVPPTLPDLRVVSVSAPDNGFSSNPITVGWRVENKGTAVATPFGSTSITDKVWLSQDTTLDASDKLLGTYARAGALDVDEGYSQINQQVTLPGAIQGNWYLLVQTDTANTVFEHAGEANNVGFDADAINVIFSPAPDLIVQTVTPPASATAGALASISFTVKNQGGGEITGDWCDAVYLSTDNILDGGDILLAQLPKSGPLAALGTYTVNEDLFIPSGTAGNFYVIVQTDCPVQFYGDLVEEFDPFINAEANNEGAALATVPVTWTPPDLQVGTVTGPANATAGSRIVVNFTVNNTGAGGTVTSRWVDAIYLSTSAAFDGSAIHIDKLGRDSALAASGTYNGSLEVTVPLALSAGNYYIHVKTDDENSVLESGNEANNTARTVATMAVGSTPPDLQLTAANAPPSPQSGQNITVTFTVQNNGTGATQPVGWSDAVWLSPDTSLEKDGATPDLKLGSIGHTGPLSVGGNYSPNAVYKLPYNISGTYYVIVETDEGGNVFEGANENNNLRVSNAMTVTLAPAPDLRVTTVSLPPNGVAGQPAAISFTVTNNGTGSTDAATPEWTDNVYISRDLILDPSDPLIGSYAHSGALAATANYVKNANIELPQGISGPYTIFVCTDAQEKVFEGNDANNSNKATFTINLAPPSDLTVFQVSVPSAPGGPNDMANYGWEIKNIGVNNASGTWTDTVFLSKDQLWDTGDIVVGSKVQNRTVAPNATYTDALAEKIPVVTPGNYYVIVRTDIRNNIRESDEGNNSGSSAGTFAVDVPQLVLGAAATPGTLSLGTERWYKILNVTEGQDILITLDSNAVADFNELYAAQNFMPTRGKYEFQQDDPKQSDQQILIPEAAAGDYYVHVFGNKVGVPLEGYTIKAQVLNFSIVGVKPNRGANIGRLTSEIRGAKFTTETTASLVLPDLSLRPAQQVYFFGTTRIYATFDLTGLAPGAYDVRIDDGANSAVANDAITVITPSAPQAPVLASLYCPGRMRIGTVVALALNYGNLTENDLEAPLFRPSADFSRMRLKEDRPYNNDGEDVIGINFNGPAGILPPGAGASIVYQMTSVSPQPAHSIHVSKQHNDGDQAPMNWPAIEAKVRPPNISDAKWNPTWTQFVTDCGPQFGGFINSMQNAATTASLRNQYLYRIVELFPFALQATYKKIFYNVTGRVYIKDKGHPLPQALVSVASDTDEANSRAAISENDGSFRIFGVPQDDYTIKVRGYTVTSTAALTVGALPVVVDIIVSEGAVVTGTVKNHLFEPLEDISVYALHPDGTNYYAATAADGTYKLSGMKSGEYTIQVDSGTLYARKETSVDLPAANSKVTGINFVLDPAASVMGFVSSTAGGAALDGASVTLAGAAYISAVRTDSGGLYSLQNVPGGTYTLTFFRAGYVPVTLTNFVVEPSQLKLQDQALVPESTLTVDIKDDQNNPLQNATVELLQGGNSLDNLATDAAGRVVFTNLPAGTYKIIATKIGNGMAEEDNIVIGTSVNVNRTLNLQRLGRVNGTVTRGGNPVAGLEIVAVSDTGFVRDTVTLANGTYEILDLPFGNYAVMMKSSRAGGTQRTDIALSAGNLTETLNFTLTGSQIKGNLARADATPVTTAIVSLVKNGRVIAQAPVRDGSYCFSFVAPDSYNLEATAYDAVFDRVAVTVGVDETVSGVNFTAGTHTLSGSVTATAGGAPVAGAIVSLSFAEADRGENGIAFATTNAGGAYTITGLPVGNYRVDISKPEFAVFSGSKTVAAGSNSFNATLAANLLLALDVRDQGTGNPIDGAAVRVFAPGGSLVLSSTVSDATGLAAAPYLTSGTFDVLVTAPGHRQMVLAGHVHNNETPVVVQLSGGPRSISGTVTDTAAKNLTDGFIQVYDATGRPVVFAQTDFNGQYTVGDLAPGIYRVEISSNGFSVATLNNVDVTAGNATGQNATLALITLPDPFFSSILSFFVGCGQLAKNGFEGFFEIAAANAQRSATDIDANFPPPLTKAEQDAILAKCPKAGPFIKTVVKNYYKKEQAFNIYKDTYQQGKDLIRLNAPIVALNGLKLAGAVAGMFVPYTKVRLLFQAQKLSAGFAVTAVLAPFLGAAASAYESACKVFSGGFPSGWEGVKDLMGNLNSIRGAFETLKNIGEARGAEWKILASSIGDSFSDIILAAVDAIALINDLQDLANDLDSGGEDIKSARETYVKAFIEYKAEWFYLSEYIKTCDGEGVKPEPDQIDDGKEIPDGDDDDGNDNDSGGPNSQTPGDWVRPVDPNEKTGPDGTGPERAIPANQPLTYTVFCENVETAAAPVQKLTIDDQLDTNLDARTFQIVEIAVGDIVIPVPPNRSIFVTRLQLDEAHGGIALDVFAGVDIFTSKAFLRVTAIDPLTGERPTDPALGFMPPNDASHRGEGHIRFRVSPKSSVANGATIRNKATIIFDELEHIDTNEVSNLVVTGGPSSQVAALPDQVEQTTITVSWSGNPAATGAGLKEYDIFVSDNNGPFTAWQNGVTFTSAQFTGQFAHTYRFYSVARDFAGNQEAPPATPDTFVEMVTHINRAPTTTGIANVNTPEDSAPQTVNLYNSFADEEDADAALIYTVTNNSNSALVATAVNGTGGLTLTYAANKFGSASITVQARDTGNKTVSTTFTVTVTSVNDAPTIASIGNVTLNAGETLAATASGSDIDTDAPNSVLTYSLGGVTPAWVTINPATGALGGTAVGGESGTATVRVTDGGNAAAETSFAITVNGADGAAPPVITSTLTAKATKDTAFTYTITATGVNPITFTATGLPAGLTLTGDIISGTPTVSGSASIVIIATNRAGSDTKTLVVDIAKPPGATNGRPVLSSAPTANPNPAVTDEAVTFTAAATDPDDALLSYTWDFGDGTSAVGASVTHVYTSPGVYFVVVTVSDGAATDEAALNLPVNRIGAGGLPNGAALITAMKLGVKLNFAKAASDSLSLQGSVPVVPGLQPNKLKVTVALGDLSIVFGLDAKGKVAAPGGSFKLSGKLKNGAYTASPLKFALKLSKQDLADSLFNLGFVNATVNSTITVPVILALGDVAYTGTVLVKYSAKSDKSGSAKN